jgi:hypothetical protein
MEQLAEEDAETVAKGQAKIVMWNVIKDSFPAQLKVSPITMIPHKLRKWRAISDLSFHLQLKKEGYVQSVNKNIVKTAPAGAINQLGHSLQRIIHAFTETDPDDKIFTAKWDIKDGFWRLDCEDVEKMEFCVYPATTRGMSSGVGSAHIVADGLG